MKHLIKTKIASHIGKYTRLVAAAIVFCGAGAFMLTSHAATPTASLEAENGTVSSTAGTINDTSASNGQAVKFGGGAARSLNCIPAEADTMTNTVSHLCGFPDTTNTGVPAGTTLTPSGSITVTQDGAVIQDLDITGQIIVKANNVTIKDVRITSGDYYPIRYIDDDNTGLLVEDSEIIGTSTDVTAGMSFANYKALRLNIHGTADGVKLEDNSDVEDSYIHDLAHAAGVDTHNDGAQSTGGSNIIFKHNSVIVTPNDSSCMQFGTESGNSSNVTISNNLYDGGGWCLRIAGTGTNIKVLDNHFGRNAAYGPYDITATVTASGNVWDDTGAPNNP